MVRSLGHAGSIAHDRPRRPPVDYFFCLGNLLSVWIEFVEVKATASISDGNTPGNSLSLSHTHTDTHTHSLCC